MCGDYSGAWDPKEGIVKNRRAQGEHFFFARWRAGDAELGFWGIYHPALADIKDRLPELTDCITQDASSPPRWDRLKFLSHQTPGWGLYYSRADHIRLWRDPFGILPIVLSYHDQGIQWATRPRFLPTPPTKIRQSRVAIFLRDENDSERDDFWQGVYRLRAGESVLLRRGQRKVFQTWWPGPIDKLDESTNLVARTEELLQQSLQRAMDRGANAVGLSGGVDSTLLLAMMVESGKKPQAFSMIDPNSPVFHEQEIVEITAQTLGVEVNFFDIGRKLEWPNSRIHHPVPDLGPTSMSEAAYMVPFLRFVQGYLEQKKSSVYLKGQGADHLFSCRREDYLRHRIFEEFRWSEIREYRRGKLALKHGLHRLNIPTVARDVRHSLLPPWLQTGNKRSAFRLVEPVTSRWWQERKMLQFQSWYWEESCRLAERYRRSLNILLLSPFLDPTIAEFAFSTPPSLLRTEQMDKMILRELLRRWLPDSVALRPKRGMFNEVIWRGLAAYLDPPLDNLLNSESLAQIGVRAPQHLSEEIVDIQQNTKKFRRPLGHPFWRVIAVVLWRQTLFQNH